MKIAMRSRGYASKNFLLGGTWAN